MSKKIVYYIRKERGNDTNVLYSITKLKPNRRERPDFKVLITTQLKHKLNPTKSIKISAKQESMATEKSNEQSVAKIQSATKEKAKEKAEK